MTVALLAQRHHQRRRTITLAVGLAGLVVAAGLSNASDVQQEIATNVVARLGPTAVPVEITVDGRDVTLRTSGLVSDAQREAVASLPGVASVRVDDGS